MPPVRGLPWTCLPLLALSCTGETLTPLHELDAFTGRVQVRREGGPSLRGRLAWDRADGNLELRVDEGPTVRRAADGRVSAFGEDGWRPATPPEAVALARIERLLGRLDSELEVVERAADHYVVAVDGQPWVVRYTRDTGHHGG